MDVNNKIDSIKKCALEEQWPFPKTFDALKDAGVKNYSVSWTNGYKSGFTLKSGDIIMEETPTWFKELEVNLIYSELNAKHALKIHQEGKTSYPEWVYEMAKAGVGNYIVNMEDRTVIYYNLDNSKSFVEKVPTIY
ncbi:MULTISPECIES: DUF1398 family protein [Francisella]|uniref:DUF1398 domain-containing protein n=1 Tax=Francisella opportunistica TaxID=2016517 RepID=A0A345JQS9_9GAMM|nr:MULTISPECIES: DUF1398 family protein [Francisella]APC91383.1 hypothetical protein BBG19_0647 [Francisella sp. MA067296]AXH29675.1 DUF1398 domain-containing protein [Francisella opportunistica]AXH31325.1 DUF1398 domain-containing protein [Francisella opportunistica]AXH32971.1 DUF1398 domain-containing protein [Francisella opportunistica]